MSRVAACRVDLGTVSDFSTGASVVAIDPSINDVGVAVWPTKAVEQLARVWSLRLDGTDLERVHSLGRALDCILAVASPECVVVLEMPDSLYVQRGRGLEALKFLLAIGAAGSAAGRRKRPLVGVGVQAWQGKTGKDKKLEKELHVKLARRLFPDVEVGSHHEADALLIGLCGAFLAPTWACLSLMRQGYPADKASAAMYEMPRRDVAAPGMLRSSRRR